MRGGSAPHPCGAHRSTPPRRAPGSRQLRRDVCAGQFKYAAHKIALLYHAVNLSRVQRDVLRKRVEKHFDEVKSATEAGDDSPQETPARG